MARYVQCSLHHGCSPMVLHRRNVHGDVYDVGRFEHQRVRESMSNFDQARPEDEKSEREHLMELAMSDRPTAPVYEVMYERRYGVNPITGEEVDG